MEFLGSVLAWIGVAILFSMAVFIHELGHFLVARKLGFKVDAFSIGFGPALWKKTIDGVEYRFSAIPFGGYVALPQLDPSGMDKVQGNHEGKKEGEEKGEKKAETLPDTAPWKRILVAFAGPFGNVVLAVFLALLIYWVPGIRTGVTSTRIGFLEKNSEAARAGLEVGDRIATVNGKRVETWTDFQTECLLAGTSMRADFGIVKKGAAKGAQPVVYSIPLSTNNVLNLSVLSGVYPEMLCTVKEVVAGSPAAEAGLKSGDVLFSVNGKVVTSSSSFIRLVSGSGDKALEFSVRRGGERLLFTIRPRYDEGTKRALIGVMIGDSMGTVKPWMMYKDPWKQLKWDSLSVARVLEGLVSPKSKGERAAIAKNVGGPVAIMVGLYNTVKGSIWDGIGFLRMICVNLAILNLLPIPVLDGGHIVFALYEMIFRRKPHPKVVAYLVNGFAILLLGLMAILVWRDIARQITMKRVEKSIQQEEVQQKGE